jgi:hypothetical protein
MLIAIDAPHFSAGVVTSDGTVVRAAPILAYMRGWPDKRVTGYAKRKGWTVTYIARNDSLPAGAPMTFACVECLSPVTVPECYVTKPLRCPDCGGEWSR